MSRVTRAVPSSSAVRLGLVLALVTACALPAWGSTAAPADSHATRGLVLDPPRPCVQDGIVLFVQGFRATPCDSFLGAELLHDRLVVVRTQVREGYTCLIGPWDFYAFPVPIGRRPAGPHELQVVYLQVTLRLDGTTDTLRVDETRLAFEVTPECDEPPLIPVDELPYVHRVGTDPSPPCPGLPTSLVVAGSFPDGCGRLLEAQVHDPEHVSLTLAPYPAVRTPCTLGLNPWSANLPLGPLDTGPHRTEIRMAVLGTNAFWPPIPRQTYRALFDFGVPARCDSGPLPYVNLIHIAPRIPCGIDPTICPDDSIVVFLGGEFPSDCFELKRVDVLPSPELVFPPPPPILRIVVDDHACQDRLCLGTPAPWNTSVTLRPMLPSDYRLRVQLAQVSCSDSVPAGPLPTAEVPFRVVPEAECPAGSCHCLWPQWTHADSVACDARVAPGDPAEIEFQIHSSVALSGLEGTFRVSQRGLRVTDMETTGPAAGMHLSWTPTLDGARFVMFAAQGAPIPPTPFGTGVPVLRLTVALEPGAPLTTYYVHSQELLGADAQGRAVERCPFRFVRLAERPAVVCAGKDCDFNVDGRTDVRDLVLMVRCVNGSGSCPPDASSRFDCDHDGDLEIADVICCAMHMLRGPGCPECPVDSVRVEPRVAARWGEPRPREGGLEVPLHLGSPWLIGAGRVTLRFPADRFRVLGVESMAGIELHHVAANEVMIGVIAPWAVVDPLPGQPVPGDITLRLGLLPGRAPGGEVEVVDGEFSGPDGVLLDVPLGTPRQALGGSPPLAVTPPRPNPFSGETRFSIDLAAPATAEVGIYDVSGRQVASLFRGELPAGNHPFAWNGSTQGGGRAREGIYFYRVTAGGRSRTGKLVLLSTP